FVDLEQNLKEQLRRKPTKTEVADIIYYYSFYAIVHGEAEAGLKYLNFAISEMELSFDEPRLSQLLSRRAILEARIEHPKFIKLAEKDALRARSLAEKYHEPHLLALSALALSICSRKKENFDAAFKYIREAEKNYAELKRIPQYIESIIEYLKVILLGLEKDAFDKKELLKVVSNIEKNVQSYIIERINVFEPEFCYLMGMITAQHVSNVSKKEILTWFSDAISLAQQFKQDGNYEYFRETCNQLKILDQVEKRIKKAKAKASVTN
ncbi:MAG TPA: hypothetical protein VIY47_15295, partial [Ignavibacteriaceae bacterium]